MDSEPLLWLDEIAEGDRPRVGGKAFALARLRRLGLPVPDGFVLTAASSLDADRRAALFAAYGRLGGRVAVRSSSTAEDTEEASFAGQYLTVLDVAGEEAVAAATERCLAALDASAYARATGAPISDVMAVLVQRFVEPRAAGVAFTRDPREAGALLVESRSGRGEDLVSGRVSPDRYVLDRETRELKAGPGGGSLEKADVLGVAALALRAEEAFGGPQDVEWAIGEEGPLLLQSRPITVEAQDAPPAGVRFLTRANVGEVLPGPVTPLTWTSVGSFLEHGFRRVAQAAGLLPATAAPFLVLHRSHLYLNLSLCVDVALGLPGLSRSDAEALILGRGTSPAPGSAPPRRRRFASLPGIALRLVVLGLRLPGLIAAARARLLELPSRASLEAAELHELQAGLAAFEAAGALVAEAHVATSGAAAVRLALLGRLLPGSARELVADRVNRLVSGLEGVASTAPTLALEELAEQARSLPEWSLWLGAHSAAALAQGFARGEAPAGLHSRLASFLRDFGHRAVSEGELATLAWEDDPTPVLAALKAGLLSSRSAGFGHRAVAAIRHAEEEALLARLGPLRRGLLSMVLRAAQAWVARREETKSMAVASVQHGRRLAREAARRLVARGVLAAEDDVFLLTCDELRGVLGGAPVAAALLRRRRRRLEGERALPVPRDLDLLGEVTEPAEEPVLQGIGVSPGVGLGRVRILGPGPVPEIGPGEILVAPVLDAGHGPALATAAGAVAEIGGLLSHGAVVARELGVPCVVDVRGATRNLREGQRVIVDGSAGRVIPVSEGTAPEQAACLSEADPADEGLHELEAHPLARESVYFNAQDEARGLHLVASLGLRRGQRGEALLALGLPDGRVLFALDLQAARVRPELFAVGGSSVTWSPTRLSFEGRVAAHEASRFPPGPIPAFLAPRVVQLSLSLEFSGTTPAFDLSQGLPSEALRALRPLGRHHVEQSGRWTGAIVVDGRRFEFEGPGGRDHSWGLRDWNAADHWRLFTACLGDDLAVHALAVGVEGRRVEGGFLWRAGRAEPITSVRYAAAGPGGRPGSLELEVASAAGPPLLLRGRVARTLTVPVQLARNPFRHLAGRPYRMMLHENFTLYEALGRSGRGMAEFTERRS
jgi:phosphohistidine swiveling domain-containing protein